ncbi:hypothetical protein CCACVL1_19476 [Corchorus capsularis]|uniref:Uncharacterized protein n=1 Tax=Corchorus capsularis TaxID=210143 RepID=A0A1R3HGN8_COCAP|nr:hypothetical protein CCACVL1_19476 [Corchorus capsularis]
MSYSPGSPRSPLKNSYPLSRNTVEATKSPQKKQNHRQEEPQPPVSAAKPSLQKQNHHQQEPQPPVSAAKPPLQKQNLRQQDPQPPVSAKPPHQNQPEQQKPVSTGIFQEKEHHQKDNFKQTNHGSYDHHSQQRQQTSVKVHSQPSATTWVSPKQDDDHRNSLLLSNQGSSQEAQDHDSSDGVASRNVTYEEFCKRDKEKNSAHLDPKTGFPWSWAPVLSSTSPPEEQPSPAKGFTPSEKASPAPPPPPPNVPSIVQPPPLPPQKLKNNALQPSPPPHSPRNRPKSSVLQPSPPSPPPRSRCRCVIL